MFDAWNLVGVGGGAAALTYLATNWRKGPGEKPTLRLSLDASGSLIGDVRFLGGGLSWIASMYTSGQTKKVLQTAAAASLFSLVQTEIVRMRLAQTGNAASGLPIFPKTDWSFGALGGPTQNNPHAAPQGAWANR